MFHILAPPSVIGRYSFALPVAFTSQLDAASQILPDKAQEQDPDTCEAAFHASFLDVDFRLNQKLYVCDPTRTTGVGVIMTMG
jgi:hypothetical protein